MDLVPFDPNAEVKRQRRHLPHWEQNRRTYFVTFRLGDSIPKDKLEAWLAEKVTWEKTHPKPWSDRDWKFYREHFLTRIERWSDRGYGACYLRKPDLREIVHRALLFFHCDEDRADGDFRYQMRNFVLMPNHVHLLVTPLPNWKLGTLIHSWKSFTAHEMNKKLGRQGPLWMDERFDHLVRNASFLLKYQRYIASNPTKAGLAENEFSLWTIR